MSGKSSASLSSAIAGGLASLCGQGAAIFSTIEGVTGTAAAAGIGCHPCLLIGSALAGIGVLAADKLRGKKDDQSHDAALQALLAIFNETSELRRRLPFAGILIEEHLKNGGSIETLNVDDNDPAYPALALYKVLLSHKADTDKKLAEILSGLNAANLINASPTAPADETTLALLHANNTALFDLIAGESIEVRSALSDISASLCSIKISIDKANDGISELREQNNQLAAQNEKLLEAIRNLSTAVSAARQAAPEEDEATIIARAHATLEKQLGLPAGILEKELPVLAKKLLADKETSAIDIAHAHFAEKQYAAAETTALSAKDKALAAATPHLNAAIEALELAAQSAAAQIQCARAIQHYREAATLTSATRDPLQWARVNYMLALSLSDMGQYGESEIILRPVIPVLAFHLGTDHYRTLGAQHNLAVVLHGQGKYAEAESQQLAVIRLRERIIGPDHPDTLDTRSNLAATLFAMGCYNEAEQQNRNILFARERVLGAFHPSTLESCSNLASCNQMLGRFAEAEDQFRAILPLFENNLGVDHPATLACNNNIALAVFGQGRCAEAEELLRKTLKARVRVLGPEHPHTLSSHYNLAATLDEQGKYAEAEVQHRATLEIRERVLGAEHPHVFFSCQNLAVCLLDQGKIDEALPFAKRSLAGCMNTYGKENPQTKLAQELVTRLESR